MGLRLLDVNLLFFHIPEASLAVSIGIFCHNENVVLCPLHSMSKHRNEVQYMDGESCIMLCSAKTTKRKKAFLLSRDVGGASHVTHHLLLYLPYISHIPCSLFSQILQ